MGGKVSLPDLPTKDFMCVTTCWSNSTSIIVMYADDAAAESVENAIISNWHGGIKDRHYLGEEGSKNCLKLILNGHPFIGTRTKEEYAQASSMVGVFLSSLYNQGWQLVVSSDLSRTSDAGTWFFQRQAVEQTSQPMLTIGLLDYDTLQINNCPDDLYDVIKKVCEVEWTHGIQSEKDKNTHEIKLKGQPWFSENKKESSSARVMLKDIIQKLSGRQYDLYCSTILARDADTDTLFFKHDKRLQGEANFLLVSLNNKDRLRLFNAPDYTCEKIKGTVLQYWPHGLQGSDVDETCYQMKLKGTPWRSDGQDAIYARRLVTQIMEILASIGYFVVTGLDISRSGTDKSVFLFRRGAPVATKFMCLYLNGYDKVRFIDAPKDVVEEGRSIVSKWPYGMDEDKHAHDGVTYQAKLKGKPWFENANGDGIAGRALLLGILSQFNGLGWRVVCSGNISQQTLTNIDCHSWWFMHDKGALSHQSKDAEKCD